MGAFALGSLNVLIGPNGSGKSNLIEAMSVLRAVPGPPAPPSARVGCQGLALPGSRGQRIRVFGWQQRRRSGCPDRVGLLRWIPR
ncbi:MAG: AAA family ATPase [Candidatus Eisenbacteria bacterium]